MLVYEFDSRYIASEAILILKNIADRMKWVYLYDDDGVLTMFIPGADVDMFEFIAHDII